MSQVKRLCTLFLAVSVLGASIAVVAHAKRPETPPASPQPPAGENAKRQEKPPPIPALIYGVVQDERAKPIARARIWLKEGIDHPFHFRAFDADDQGRFNITMTKPAPVTLVALAKGYSYTGRYVSLQEGQPGQKVVLRLYSPEELRLRIVTESGKPVSGAELEYLSWATDRNDPFWLPPEILTNEGIARPVSNKDGLITLGGIPKGAKCQGQIKHSDFARQPFNGVEAGNKQTDVRVSLGHVLTIVVTDGATKKPAVGARVSIFAREAGSVGEMVDGEGRLLVRLADAQNVTVRVSHPQLMSPRQVGIPRWSGVSGSTLEIELFPKVKVTGRCVDQLSGRPIAGIQLGLASHGVNQIIGYGHSDADGRYEIEAPAGPSTVEALNGADRRESPSVAADTAKTTQMPDLKLKLLPMVRGQVVGTDGKPVSSAFVMYAWHPLRRTSVLADKEGRFEFRMHEDDFGVTITALHPTDRRAGGGVISREDLKAGKEMRIVVQPESEIRGTVVDSGGKPQASIKVWLMAKTEAVGWGISGGQASTVTDVDGSYRFPGLGRNPKQFRVNLSGSWDDAAAPSSKWITADKDTIVVDPLKATEKYLKVKAELPSLAAAPEFRCRQWLNPQPINVESQRGKVVLLAFDATWSKQSADELAEIQLAHQLYADKGLVVIGVHHHGERVEDVAAFAAKKKLTFPIGIDNADAETFDRYGVNYYPRCVLIGRDGKRVPEGWDHGWDNGNFLAAVRKAVLYGR